MYLDIAWMISPAGYTPALACAPTSEVADCLAMILATMFPPSPNCTLNRSTRINSNTINLGKCMFACLELMLCSADIVQ